MTDESKQKRSVHWEEPPGRRRGIAFKKTIKPVEKDLVIWYLLHVKYEDQRSDPHSLVGSNGEKQNWAWKTIYVVGVTNNGLLIKDRWKLEGTG